MQEKPKSNAAARERHPEEKGKNFCLLSHEEYIMQNNISSIAIAKATSTNS